jgi:probable rRNA maturation factor
VADPPSRTGGTAPTVVCADEQDDVDIDAARWSALAEAVLRAEGAVGELTLTFVDRAEIASLNAEHMGVEAPTDVLSFPLDAFDTRGETGDTRGETGDTRGETGDTRGETGDTVEEGGAPPVLLGDVVVCPSIAVDAAPDHGVDADDELALLVVHGVLHVLGHDHAEPGEAASMRERERVLLSEYHWHGPAPATFRRWSVPTMSRRGPVPGKFFQEQSDP